MTAEAGATLPTDAVCNPSRSSLRSLCGPNPREHPRTLPNAALMTPSLPDKV